MGVTGMRWNSCLVLLETDIKNVMGLGGKYYYSDK